MNGPYDPIDLGPISIQWVRVYFTKAGVNTPVPHGLRGTIMEASLARSDKPCILSDGQMPPAPGVVQLVSDTDKVTATIRVMAVNTSER